MSRRGRTRRERERASKTVKIANVELEALELAAWRREDVADKPGEWLLMRGDRAILRVRQR